MTTDTLTETSPTRTPRPVNLNHGCLALNASYEPLVIMDMKRAVRLVLSRRAEVVESDPTRIIRSEGVMMESPVVIRLVRFVHVPRRFRKGVTNTFLFARDGYTCGYCGRHKRELRQREFLTRDHIRPQSLFASREDANTWENVVTACNTCNNRKADVLPEELGRLGMKLRVTPTVPHFVRLEWTVRKLTPMQRKYVAQFFGVDALDAIS